MTNEKIIWNFFKDNSINDYAIAGIMGNLYAESNLRSNNLQNTYEKKLNMSDEVYTSSVNNKSYTNFIQDKAGYGLAQWTYWSRKQALLELAQTRNKSIDDIHVQLEYLYQELKQLKLIDKLNKSTSVKQASDIVLLDFEKPYDQSDNQKNKRAEFSNTYYVKYAVK